jgi:hypothetical protein
VKLRNETVKRIFRVLVLYTYISGETLRNICCTYWFIAVSVPWLSSVTCLEDQ